MIFLLLLQSYYCEDIVYFYPEVITPHNVSFTSGYPPRDTIKRTRTSQNLLSEDARAFNAPIIDPDLPLEYFHEGYAYRESLNELLESCRSHPTICNKKLPPGKLGLKGTYDKYGQIIGDGLLKKKCVLDKKGLRDILSNRLTSGTSLSEGFRTPRFEFVEYNTDKLSEGVKYDIARDQDARVRMIGAIVEPNDTDPSRPTDPNKFRGRLLLGYKDPELSNKNCILPSFGFGYKHCEGDAEPLGDKILLKKWRGNKFYYEPYTFGNTDSDDGITYSEGDRLKTLMEKEKYSSDCKSKYCKDGVRRFLTPRDMVYKTGRSIGNKNV